MRKSYLYLFPVFLALCLALPLTASATKAFKILQTSGDLKSAITSHPSSNIVYCTEDAEGNQIIRNLTTDLVIQNTGDEDLNPGDEGYSVSIAVYYFTNFKLKSIPVPVAIPAGETKVVSFDWGADGGLNIMPLENAEHVGYMGGTYHNFNDGRLTYQQNNTTLNANLGFVAYPDMEGSTNNYLYLVEKNMEIWLDCVAYELLPEEGTTPLTGTISFGYGDPVPEYDEAGLQIGSHPYTYNMRLFCKGARDINITSLSLPAGYTTTLQTPVLLRGGLNAATPEEQYMTIPVTFNPEEAGTYMGNMTLNIEGEEPILIPFIGAKKGGNFYFNDFEGISAEAATPGWLWGAEMEWKENTNATICPEGEHYVNHNRSGTGYISDFISPLLHFDADQAIVFDGRTNTSSGNGYPVIKVKYSADRETWEYTDLKIYTNNTSSDNTEATELFLTTSPYLFRQYGAAVPEGDWYVAFEMGYASIDNFFGGVPVEVPYDIFAQEFSAPATGMVNNAGTFTFTLRNLNITGLSQNDYKVALYIDGAKVADCETRDWGPNETFGFTANYTPHVAGLHTVYMELTAGENYTVKSSEVEWNVSEEMLVAEATVGTPADMSTSNSTLPLYLNYNNSRSQILLTEAYLSQYGITPGTVISGMYFLGYANGNKDYTSNMTVRMASSDLTTMAASDAVELTDDDIVFHNEAYPIQFTTDNRGSRTDIRNHFDFMFDEPFVYNGGSLLIDTSSEASTYVNYYFQFTNESGIFGREKHNDNHNSYLNASYSLKSSSRPVINFHLKADPTTMSGTVTADGEAVEGATVTLTGEGDVIYTATTDEAGAYSFPVFKNTIPFAMTVSAPGYTLYEAQEPITFDEGSVVKDIELVTYVLVSGNVTNTRGEAVEGVNIVATSGDNTASALTDAEGNYTVRLDTYGTEIALLADPADYKATTATLEMPVARNLSQDFTVESFTNKREFTLKVKVDPVVETNLEGIRFALKSERFNETYPNADCILDANGEATVTVYGGAHSLTVKSLGVAETTVEFNVNRDTDVAVVMGEDVQAPKDLNATLIHDAISGKNDLYVTWTTDNRADRATHRVIRRTAANPYEKFYVYLDGTKLGETEEYEYTIENVSGGSHTVTVTSVYSVTPGINTDNTVNIANDNYAPVVFTLTANNGASTEGMVINLRGADGAGYAVEADENGRALVGYLPMGHYTIAVEEADFRPFSQEADIQEPAFFDINLSEIVVKPYNLTVDLSEDVPASTFDVTANWNQALGLFDSFEAYDDFATAFGDWKTLDLNTQPSYPMMLGNKQVTFPGASTMSDPVSVAPMIFNPAATEPSMEADPNVTAFAGMKSVIFEGPQATKADKWLISPEIEVRDGFLWSLEAKAYAEYAETLELCISTDGDAPENFTVLQSVNPGHQVWQNYTVDLSAYAGQNVRVAVHCVSYDGFMVQVDNFRVTTADGQEVTAPGKVLNYELTLDDQTATTEDTTYTFTGVKEGPHTLTVKAIYASGASEAADYSFSMLSGIGLIDANAERGDVVTPAGVTVLRDATEAQIRRLAPGIYLFRGRKVIVK